MIAGIMSPSICPTMRDSELWRSHCLECPCGPGRLRWLDLSGYGHVISRHSTCDAGRSNTSQVSPNAELPLVPPKSTPLLRALSNVMESQARAPGPISWRCVQCFPSHDHVSPKKPPDPCPPKSQTSVELQIKPYPARATGPVSAATSHCRPLYSQVSPRYVEPVTVR